MFTASLEVGFNQELFEIQRKYIRNIWLVPTVVSNKVSCNEKQIQQRPIILRCGKLCLSFQHRFVSFVVVGFNVHHFQDSSRFLKPY